MAVERAYSPINEILDFLLTQPTPYQIIALQASDTAQERLRYLLDGNRKNMLNDAERAELDAHLCLAPQGAGTSQTLTGLMTVQILVFYACTNVVLFTRP